MRIFDRARVESYCGPTTLYHVISQIFPWVLFLGTGVALAAGWGRIPEQVPLQFDTAGNVSDYGPRSTLLVLYGVFFLLNATFCVVDYFPNLWNGVVRFRSMGVKLNGGKDVRSYRLMRDFLSDMRISMAILLSIGLLGSAFCAPQLMARLIGWGVWVLFGVPILRYVARLFLFR